jgi:hypothetical protein
MATKELNTKEQLYADSMQEAEHVVEEAKEDVHLTSWKISEKHNKYGTYYLVDLAFSYDTPKEIMESAPSKKKESAPVEQHEGVEYSVNGDGTVSLDQNQMTIDEVENEEEDEQ